MGVILGRKDEQNVSDWAAAARAANVSTGEGRNLVWLLADGLRSFRDGGYSVDTPDTDSRLTWEDTKEKVAVAYERIGKEIGETFVHEDHFEAYIAKREKENNVYRNNSFSTPIDVDNENYLVSPFK